MLQASHAHAQLLSVGLIEHAEADGEVPGERLNGVRPRDLERFQAIIDELKSESSVGLAAVSVAARELSVVADRVARGPGVEDRR